MRNKSFLVTVYYALAAIAFFATWYFNWQYIAGGGSFEPAQFLGTAFANVLTTAITIDVYFAAVVFSIWVVSDSKQNAIKWPWAYVALCFCVGLAIAFPLYLANKNRNNIGEPANA
ncbi:MAG: DUF2834 domain-containing protein [Polaromonas sp.]